MTDNKEQTVSLTSELTNEQVLTHDEQASSVVVTKNENHPEVLATSSETATSEEIYRNDAETNNVSEQSEELERQKNDKKEQVLKDKKQKVELLENGEVLIEGRRYRLVENYREAFDSEQLNARYSDVLARYDFIVGDIGFEQLRLRGFFSDDQKKMPNDQRIGSLQDYLYEYCNFGCAYFVLESLEAPVPRENKPNRNKRQNRNKSKPRNQAHIQEKQGRNQNPTVKHKTTKKSPVIKNRRESEATVRNKSASPVAPKKKQTERSKEQRSFTIRQKENK